MHSELAIWSSITSDRFIIETVKWGLRIDLISKPANKCTPQMAHSAEESKIISEEIAKLVKKGVIKECDREREVLFLLSFLGGRKIGHTHYFKFETTE